MKDEIYNAMILAISGAIAYLESPELYDRMEILQSLLDLEVALETGKLSKKSN